MSTRCNIVIKDKYDKFILYHHHDGYPEGVGNDLVGLMKNNNVKSYFAESLSNCLIKNTLGLNDGEYKITSDLHRDIEYLYEIDLESYTLKCWSVRIDWQTGEINSKTEVNLADYTGKNMY